MSKRLLSLANRHFGAFPTKLGLLAVTLVAAAMLAPSFCESIEEAYGQSCRPAVIAYIVRDGKGNVLNEAQLQSLRKGLESWWNIRRLPFSENGKTLISEYSAEADQAKNLLPVLYVADSAGCEVGLTEVTLKYGGKSMRLLFNVRVFRRAIAIDSLPFEEGTFELQLDSELPDRKEPYRGEGYLPAERWKKISNKP
jgi:hypothetical protein